MSIRRTLIGILVAGLVAGVLDIIYAFVLSAMRGGSIVRGVQAIASGVLVYLFMNFVVLPLSAVPFKINYTAEVVLQGFVSHALLAGIPIALCLRRFASPPSPLAKENPP